MPAAIPLAAPCRVAYGAVRTGKRVRGTEEHAITTWRWIDTITRQLELCDARPGETAAVLALDTDSAELRGLFSLALERLGVSVNEIVVRSGVMRSGGDPVDNEAVAAALLHSDLVVDLNGALVERSSALSELLDEARVLAVDAVDVEDLDRLVSHPGLLRRIDRAHKLIDEGTSLSVSTEAGTQLDVDLTDGTVVTRTGVVTLTGDLAHWPAGEIWTEPKAGRITGTVVAMPGDLAVQVGHIMRSPVRLEIERGRLVDVLGDSGDGDLIRSFLEHFDDEHVYDVDRLGWGLNYTHGVSSLGLFDQARLALGRGPMTAGVVNVGIGGHAAGLTLGLFNCTVSIDDATVVDAGAPSGPLAPDIYELAAGT